MKKVNAKPWHYVVLVAIVVFTIGYRLYSLHWNKAEVTVGGTTFTVLVADTYPHAREGWSNKKDMGGYGGMLFTFQARGQHTMVMRDMHFPLDIIWIDGGKIVDIAPSVPPEPDKAEAELTPYFSRLPSTFVLEVPAGFAKERGLKIGDGVEFTKK